MKRIALSALAASAALMAGTALAQQPDRSGVQIKTTDLGNKTYRLEGAGGNITIAVGTDGIIMVDSQFADMGDRIKTAIKAISAADQVPDPDALPRRPHRRRCELPEGRRHGPRAGQYPHSPACR